MEVCIMGRKLSDKGLTKKVDDLWSLIVRFRADNRCEVCGVKKGVQAHHLISRKNWRLRWETKNGVALCPKHHKFDRHKSAHFNPLWFNDWLEENHPEDVKWLKERQEENYSWKRGEKNGMVKELESLLSLEDKKKIFNFEIKYDGDCYLPRLHT